MGLTRRQGRQPRSAGSGGNKKKQQQQQAKGKGKGGGGGAAKGGGGGGSLRRRMAQDVYDYGSVRSLCVRCLCVCVYVDASEPLRKP